MAEPLTCFAPPERARVRAVLAELGLLPPNEPAAGDRQLEPPDRERDG